MVILSNIVTGVSYENGANVSDAMHQYISELFNRLHEILMLISQNVDIRLNESFNGIFEVSVYDPITMEKLSQITLETDILV